MDKTVQPPVLRTARLTLRPLERRDAGPIHLYAGDERVALHLAVVPHPYPEGAAEMFIERAQDPANTEIIWAIDKDNELIGVISITPTEDGRGNIGYWLAPQFWGAGFTPEALEAVIAHARALGFTGLDASVHQDNPKSARVLVKQGFEYTGDSETYSVPRGAVVSSWDYRLELADG